MRPIHPKTVVSIPSQPNFEASLDEFFSSSGATAGKSRKTVNVAEEEMLHLFAAIEGRLKLSNPFGLTVRRALGTDVDPNVKGHEVGDHFVTQWSDGMTLKETPPIPGQEEMGGTAESVKRPLGDGPYDITFEGNRKIVSEDGAFGFLTEQVTVKPSDGSNFRLMISNDADASKISIRTSRGTTTYVCKPSCLLSQESIDVEAEQSQARIERRRLLEGLSVPTEKRQKSIRPVSLKGPVADFVAEVTQVVNACFEDPSHTGPFTEARGKIDACYDKAREAVNALPQRDGPEARALVDLLQNSRFSEVYPMLFTILESVVTQRGYRLSRTQDYFEEESPSLVAAAPERNLALESNASARDLAFEMAQARLGHRNSTPIGVAVFDNSAWHDREHPLVVANNAESVFFAFDNPGQVATDTHAQMVTGAVLAQTQTVNKHLVLFGFRHRNSNQISEEFRRHNVRLVNLSVDGVAQVRDMMKMMKDHPDVLFVVAAGNDHKNDVELALQPNSIFVAAADRRSGNLEGFSNYGDDIDFATFDDRHMLPAPGGYREGSGTSSAAPETVNTLLKCLDLCQTLTAKQLISIAAAATATHPNIAARSGGLIHPPTAYALAGCIDLINKGKDLDAAAAQMHPGARVAFRRHVQWVLDADTR